MGRRSAATNSLLALVSKTACKIGFGVCTSGAARVSEVATQ